MFIGITLILDIMVASILRQTLKENVTCSFLSNRLTFMGVCTFYYCATFLCFETFVHCSLTYLPNLQGGDLLIYLSKVNLFFLQFPSPAPKVIEG